MEPALACSEILTSWTLKLVLVTTKIGTWTTKIGTCERSRDV